MRRLRLVWRLLSAGVLDRGPRLRGRGWRVHVRDAEVGDGVYDGVYDGRGGTDGPGLADALYAERVGASDAGTPLPFPSGCCGRRLRKIGGSG